MEELSNYEKIYKHFQKLFLEIDHKNAAEKLCLNYDDNNILIPFFNRPIVLNRNNAEMTSTAYPKEIPVIHRLLVLKHVYYHKANASNSGEMVSFRNIRECAIFDSAFQRNSILPFVKAFDDKTELLKKRASQMGCVFNSFGDVNFTINAFPLIPMQFIFWDRDEEFPANANILFDKNIAQFINADNISFLAEIAVKLLIAGDKIHLST